MKEFNKVAIIDFQRDFTGCDYAIALYDDEAKLIDNSSVVVVNDIEDENARDIAYIKEIISVKDCNQKIEGQVVGVVNMDAYNKRHIEGKD